MYIYIYRIINFYKTALYDDDAHWSNLTNNNSLTNGEKKSKVLSDHQTDFYHREQDIKGSFNERTRYFYSSIHPHWIQVYMYSSKIPRKFYK